MVVQAKLFLTNSGLMPENAFPFAVVGRTGQGLLGICCDSYGRTPTARTMSSASSPIELNTRNLLGME